MAIILQDTGLENELMELSKKLHIKVDELLKNFVKEQIEKVKSSSIDTSHIELVDEEERDDILKNSSLISKEDNEIDTNATKIISI